MVLIRLGLIFHCIIDLLHSQRLVVAVVDCSLREWAMKDSVLMLNVIAALAEQLDQDSTEVLDLGLRDTLQEG